MTARDRAAETLAIVGFYLRRVPRPPTWLIVAGWAVMGLAWLSDSQAVWLLAFGGFTALTLWWGLWFGQRGRP
jgi:hypothetical protein